VTTDTEEVCAAIVIQVGRPVPKETVTVCPSASVVAGSTY
jgi:hypothetical protein